MPTQFQIIGQYDTNSQIQGYEVRTWNGKDGAMISTYYTPSEALTAFPVLLDASVMGTSRTPDRVTAIYKDDSTLLFAHAEVSSAVVDKLEVAPIKTNFSDIQLQSIAVSKADIEAETGKTLSGADVKGDGGGGAVPLNP
jgi:hypothetical protein